jgi:hypothetical protein
MTDTLHAPCPFACPYPSLPSLQSCQSGKAYPFFSGGAELVKNTLKDRLAVFFLRYRDGYGRAGY